MSHTEFHALVQQATGDRLALLGIHVSMPNAIHYADCFQLMDWLYRAGIKVDAIITDMPYGTTACSWDVRVDLERWWTSVKRVLKSRGVFLTTASEPFASLLRVSNLDWYKYDWVWVKEVGTNFLNASREPMKEHEQILIFSCQDSNYYPQYIKRKDIERAKYPYKPNVNNGGKVYGNYDFPVRMSKDLNLRIPSSILKINRQMGLHPTQKPVALYEYLIRTYTQPGDLVLDPFCGSGTTGLAALKTGRRFILGDSDLGYVQAARKRIQNADPMQPSQLAEGVTQLSLFAEAI